MAYLTTVTGIIGAGLAVNLALTFAVIRQVRQIREELARRAAGRNAAAFLPAGTKVPEFAVRTMTDEARSVSDLAGARSVIAFMTPWCAACENQIPAFRNFVRTIPGGAAQVLVIIVSVAGNPAADLALEFGGAATVAFEPRQGPAQTALSVWTYPSFYVLDANGRVEAGGHTVRQVAPAEPGQGEVADDAGAAARRGGARR
jgi:thiol-disulfide isomerase/thioredoxin